MSQLVTGEAVALDLQVAGVPSRIAAAALDGVLQALLFTGVLLLVGAAGSSAATTAALVVGDLVVAGLLYPVLMEGLVRGRTVGKMAMGLRVVRDDGGPIGLRQALVRGLIGLFVERPGATSGSAAVICALLNSRGKRLGDLAAGTIVVQERVARTRQVEVTMPPPLAAWAATLDLTQLPDETVQRARALLVRWAALTPAAQHELGSRMAAEVAALVAPPPPSGAPAWAYLAAVVSERRRRAFLEAAPPPPPAPAPVPPTTVRPAPEDPAGSPFAPPG